MLQNIWKAYGLTIDAEDFSSLRIAGITDYDVPDDMQLDRPNVDGSPYSIITRLQSRDETISLTTLNIDDAIDVCGLGGQCIKGIESQQGVRLWLARWDQCTQVPVPGAVHRYYGINFTGETPTNRAIINISSISCQHRADATAQVQLNVLADPNLSQTFGVNVGTNVALPANVSDNQRRYTLGPMQVGGIPINNKTGFEIATNINVEKISVDSEIAAHFAHVNEHKPVITIRGIDPTWDIPRSGLICTHANTEMYLRRRGETAGNDFEPNNQAKHIKFTAKGRAFLSKLAGGSGSAPSETVLMIYPEFDPTSNMVPIIGLTGQQINEFEETED